MIVTGAILGAIATLLALMCLAGIRRQKVAARKYRAEALSILKQQREETAQQIAQISRTVESLSECRQSMEAASSDGLPLSRRRDAIRLLRSGVSPETAASSLGIAAREMRLISTVFRVLKPD